MNGCSLPIWPRKTGLSQYSLDLTSHTHLAFRHKLLLCYHYRGVNFCRKASGISKSSANCSKKYFEDPLHRFLQTKARLNILSIERLAKASGGQICQVRDKYICLQTLKRVWRQKPRIWRFHAALVVTALIWIGSLLCTLLPLLVVQLYFHQRSSVALSTKKGAPRFGNSLCLESLDEVFDLPRSDVASVKISKNKYIRREKKSCIIFKTPSVKVHI